MASVDMKKASENFWDRLYRFLKWHSDHRQRRKLPTYRATFKEALRQHADEKRKGGVFLKMKFVLVLETILTAYTVWYLIFGGKWGLGKAVFSLFLFAGMVALLYDYLSSRFSLEQIYNEAASDAYQAQYEEFYGKAPAPATPTSTGSTTPTNPATGSTGTSAPAAPTEADFQAMYRNLDQLASDIAQHRNNP